MLATLAVSIGFAVLLAASLCDLGWRLIPNALPLALAACGLVLHLLAGWASLLAGLAVCAAVSTLLVLAWMRGLIGGGDAKLAAAASLFVPPAAAPVFALGTALAGGVLALLFLAARPLLPARIRPAGRRAPLLRRLARTEAWHIRRGLLPYAVAIAAGTVLARAEAAVS